MHCVQLKEKMSSKKHLLCLRINQEQEQAIFHLFHSHDWDLEVVDMQPVDFVEMPPQPGDLRFMDVSLESDPTAQSNSNGSCAAKPTDQDESESDDQDDNAESDSEPESGSGSGEDIGDDSDPSTDGDEEQAADPNPFPQQLIDPVGPNGGDYCEHCLCTPCITNEENRQPWWEAQNRPPRQNNHSKRKKKYRLFWIMLGHRGIWNHPTYLERKLQALNLENNGRRFVYNTAKNYVRDIMPNCVIDKVREWLPNLPSQPYMGHKWE